MKNVFILLALSTCPFISFTQKRYYTPSAYQISAHDKKGQISLSIARGNGYDVNVSYALTNNLCVLFAYNENKRYEERTTLFSSYGIQNNNTSTSGRLGYFRNITKKDWLNRIEAYLGYSHTKIDNYWDFIEISSFDPEYAEYAKTNYNAVFIGSDLVVDASLFEFSISSRFCFYKYGSFVFYDKNPNTYYPTSTIENLKGINLELIPGIGIKYKGFKLLVQGGVSVPVSSPYAIQTDTYPSNVGTSVVTHKEKRQSGSFIFRLGLQFKSGYKKKK